MALLNSRIDSKNGQTTAPKVDSAKEYLNSYHDVQNDINAKLDEILRLRELAAKTTQTMAEVRAQPNGSSRIETTVQKIIDMENDVECRIADLAAVKLRIEETISQVPEPRLHALLSYRYFSFESFEDIAEKMEITWRHAMRLHKKALEEVEHLLYGC